jgi:two-component system chemotaxis response regulator CheB
MGSVGSLHRLVQAMPADAPPTVAVVPLPARLTPAVARHLERSSAVRVREARAGDAIERGHVLLAPGDRHVTIAHDRDHLRVDLDAGHPVHGHRPSLDVLFASAARQLRHDALGVILSGEGEDGVAGLHALHEAGAMEILDFILGQDLARREAA